MKNRVICFALAAMLSACGGGGGDNGTAQAATISSAPAGSYQGNLTGQNIPPSPQVFVKFGNAPFQGGTLYSVDTSFPDSSHVQMDFGSPPNWNGSIVFTNNTTGVSVVMSKTVSPNQTIVWQATTNPPNLIRNGVTDSFTVSPSN